MRHKSLIFIIFLSQALAYIFSQSSTAATINIAPGESIQSAINTASNGDVLVLAEGKYRGNINFEGKAITIQGIGRKSVIKGNGSQATVVFNHDEGSGSVLDQVKITGGFRGGAMLIENASPNIQRCWIEKNKAIGAGSGVFIFGNGTDSKSATLINNVFSRNKTRSFKPGNIAHALYIEDASPTVTNNSFVKNDRAAIYITGLSSPIIQNNIFSHNGKVKSHSKNTGIGVSFEFIDSGSSINLAYNLFFKNREADIIYEGEKFKSINDIGSNGESLTGVSFNSNISGDPEFTKIKKARDLSIEAGSAAIDAGNPDASFNDTNTSRNDIGASGGALPNPDLL